MTELGNSRIPKPYVIPRLDREISFKIPSKIPSLFRLHFKFGWLSFLLFLLLKPCAASTLQASFYTLFLHKPLLFSLVSGLLEKSAQNSLERYRYGAPRLALRQNSKKSPHDLGALFLLPLARSPKDSAS